MLSGPALRVLEDHLTAVRGCTACPDMVGPVVTPRPVWSKVYLCGQAPGPHEGKIGQPFAWTAGKTMFRWFEGVGVVEETFRSKAWMAAVCRCFPGKTKQGGDRVPSVDEVASCSRWMEWEIRTLRPDLVVPVGRLAIELFLPKAPLADVIGKRHDGAAFGHRFDLIPLPHPSGASTWFKVEPGKSLLAKALRLLRKHPAWRSLTSPS